MSVAGASSKRVDIGSSFHEHSRRREAAIPAEKQYSRIL
jgi:hypothetical protein